MLEVINRGKAQTSTPCRCCSFTALSAQHASGMTNAAAVAAIYNTDVEIFPDMGPVMMLEPGWQAVAERIGTGITARGL